jgi:hypothetical protein
MATYATLSDGGGGYATAVSASSTPTDTEAQARLEKQLKLTQTQLEIETASKEEAQRQLYQLDKVNTDKANQASLKTSAGGSSGDDIEVGVPDPIGYKFNLPPHNWSLPVRPIELEPYDVGVINNKTGYFAADVFNATSTPESFHGTRRGRIWYWHSASALQKFNTDSGKVESLVDATSKLAKTTEGVELKNDDRKWGFQFLWNPSEIQSNVARNMDITPSAADTLRVVSGVFPGQETVSFNILLDRTNDFACIRSSKIKDFSDYSKFYTATYPGQGQQVFGEQLEALMRQGTMADLEYLFRAINGSGMGVEKWGTLMGKRTANLGYLQPTLLGISLGPDRLNNLSYVGWLSNIAINHNSFTQDMVPIRTTVTLSIECFAGTGIGAG